MKEKQFFNNYSIIELQRNGIFQYYLARLGYGNLMYLYGTMKECFPSSDGVLGYIDIANNIGFWND
jgi:hypothetical protein